MSISSVNGVQTASQNHPSGTWFRRRRSGEARAAVSRLIWGCIPLPGYRAGVSDLRPVLPEGLSRPLCILKSRPECSMRGGR